VAFVVGDVLVGTGIGAADISMGNKKRLIV
jgi:hypothetical protein